MKSSLQTKRMQRQSVAMQIPEIFQQRQFSEKGDQSIGWKRGRLIGKGAHSRVYEMRNLATGKVLAGKLVDLDSLDSIRLSQLEVEVMIHKSMDHPHIVKLYSTFRDHGYQVFLMELCPRRSLYEMVKVKLRIGEKDARVYFSQILDALEYIHADRCVIHRDLKLANILLGNVPKSGEGDEAGAGREAGEGGEAGEQNSWLFTGTVKICDFGLSAQMDRREKVDSPEKGKAEYRRGRIGTINYMAPEVLDNRHYSYSADIWSLGVILYTMLVGKPPFETSAVAITESRILTGTYRFPCQRVKISAEAKDLIRWMLQVDPLARPSLSEIRRHTYLIPLRFAVIPKLVNFSIGPVTEISQFLIEKISAFYSIHRLESGPETETAGQKDQEDGQDLDWIQRWELVENQGLAYRLMGGTFGFYFNDGSSMISYFDQKEKEKKEMIISSSREGGAIDVKMVDAKGIEDKSFIFGYYQTQKLAHKICPHNYENYTDRPDELSKKNQKTSCPIYVTRVDMRDMVRFFLFSNGMLQAVCSNRVTIIVDLPHMKIIDRSHSPLSPSQLVSIIQYIVNCLSTD